MRSERLVHLIRHNAKPQNVSKHIKNMKSTIAIYLFILMVTTSCSTVNKGFIAKHKKKKIHLTEFSEPTIKIGYETDSAIIYFGVHDMIRTTEDILSSGKLQPRWDYRTIEDLKKNLKFLQSIKNDLIVENWQNQKDSIDIDLYNFSGFIDQWIFKDYLFDHMAMVWNKSKKRYEKIIYYHFVRDRLGGEYCYYTFENGVEFHRQLIALGE